MQKYRKQETPPPVKGRCHMTVQTDEQYFDDDLWERLLVSKPSVESQEDESQSATQEEDGIDGSNNDGNVSSTTDADADTANANVNANEQTINDVNKEDGTEMKINAGNTCDNLVKFIIEEARENALNAMDESFDSVVTAPT